MECKDESSSNEFEMTVLSTKLMIGENQDNLLLSTNQSDNVGITNDSNDPISTSTNKGELLRWNYRLGYLSWFKLKLLALLGIIPRKLASI